MQNKINKQKGYTLVETIIAVSLFLIVMVIGMGALLNANLVHQKSQDMRSIMDNLSFIMEDMSRNLRTGYNYRCIDSKNDFSSIDEAKNGDNCKGVAFESSLLGDTTDPDDQWVYYIGDTKKVLRSTKGPYNINDFIQLTPDEVEVNGDAFGFSVSGAPLGVSDNQQPFVTIRLVGEINYKDTVTPFSLQTSVSQRKIDR